MVGDRFWLAYAQDIVRGAIQAPEKRAEQLAAAIAWFWTLYSAAALVVLTIGGTLVPMPAAMLIALPSAVLVLAYWMAARVRRPLLMDFDPRIPSEIEAMHAKAAAEKRSALTWAERLTAAAALSVVAALATALFVKPPPSAALTVQVDPADSHLLLVSAVTAKNAAVRLSAEAPSSPASAASAPGSVAVLERADATGLLRTQLRAQGAAPYRVTASWQDDGLQHSLSVEVKAGR